MAKTEHELLRIGDLEVAVSNPAKVLFPDADVLGTGRIAASPFGTGLAGAADNAEEAIAGSRAHNRWLADFARADPDRRIGVAVIPAIIPDMDTVLALVREAKELGHRGILIPTRWFDRPAYHDPWYEPLWTLTEELGLPLDDIPGAERCVVIVRGSAHL